MWLVLQLLALSAAPAQVTTLPPLSKLERTLAAHARDGKLEGVSLLEAALLASGVPEARLGPEAARVKEALAPAIEKAGRAKGEAARAKALLVALHETVLRRYELGATELHQVVRTGEFNCLSSALLYLVAAEGLLPSARGVVTPHHAFVRVTVGQRVVDVETTSPAGFDPDRGKLTAAQARALAGGEVSAEAFRAGLQQAEELPSLSLVAAVYSNRAIGLARRGETAAAAVALDRGARMATGGLQLRLADWRASLLSKAAKELVELRRFDDARRLLELGLEVTQGSHRALLARALAIVHHHLGLAAAERKDWVGALSHVETAEGLGLGDDALKDLKAKSLAQLAALEGSASRCRAEGLTPSSPGALTAARCLAALADELVERDSARSLQYARLALQLAPAEQAAAAAVVLALDRQARVASDAGRCLEVEALVAEGLPYAPALAPQQWDGLRLAGVCWAQRSRGAFDAAHWQVARQELQRAQRFLPGDAAVAQSLARVAMNQGIELANQGNCDEARPHLVASVQGEPGLREKAAATLGVCAGQRAARAAAVGDWAAAILEVRRGLRDAPGDPTLQKNLQVALHNHAAALLNTGGACEELRSMLPELASVKAPIAATVRQACP